MVSLEVVRASNARIKSQLPSGPVAVFIGATSGIGETTLKHFAESALKPRIYFTGRRRECGSRIQGELQKLNPDGEYIYLENDCSLIRNVDSLCRDIAAKEESINLLCITMGTLISGTMTEEGLHYAMALTYYCRIRFVMNLLPLIKRASTLRRVMTVFAATKEGPIYTDDLPALRLPITKARGHIVSMITLAFEHISKQAPEVSFIHDYPGFVNTGMSRELKPSLMMTVMKGIFRVIGLFLNTPIDEVGERQLFIATSARFPAQTGGADGVPLGEGLEIATGTEGKTGGGVYSIDNLNEPAGQSVLSLLSKLRQEGIAEQAWKHTEAEFLRVTGSLSS